MEVQTDDKKLNGGGLRLLWNLIKGIIPSKTSDLTNDSHFVSDSSYYPDLHAGLADNLFGETQANDMFTFRPTAGIQDIESGEPPLGGASVKRIDGNAVAWNQLVYNGDFSDGTNGWTGNIANLSVSNGILNCVATEKGLFGAFCFPNSITGHKYYISTFVKSDRPLFLGLENSVSGLFNVPSSSSTVGYICQAGRNDDAFVLYAQSTEVGDVLQVKYVQLIDLTLIFGSGNEPSTVAEFESWLERNIGKKDYYPYNTGELIPVKDFKVRSVGFNAWDEEWKLGYYSNVTGQYVSDTQYLCVKNPVRVLPNTTYSVCKPEDSYEVLFYDADNNLINATGRTTFTTPSNCAYLTFWLNSTYGTTYNNDICISLSYDDDKDGTYEEHWEHETAIDVTTLKGKLNGIGDSVVVFPDGLKSAGNVHDEIVKSGDVTKAIKRIGAVDLGTQKWSVEGNNTFAAPPIDYKFTDDYTANYLCNRYMSIPHGARYKDKSVFLNEQCRVLITDSSYSDAATFKTAMSGVILYYELAEPEEYIIDDALLPVKYAVDDYGTEELLLGNDTEVVSVAPTMTIKYGINAADTVASLPHNYVSSKYQSLNDDEQKVARNNIGAASQKDMIVVKKQLELIDKKVENDYYVDMGLPSGVLWAKRNIDLSQADKFAPSEYSYDASFFSWGNTDGHNPTGTTFDYDFGTSNDGTYASTLGAKLTGNISQSYDAAHVNLGEPWRMPTTEEFKELFDNCDFIDANGDVIPSTTTNKLVTMSGVVGIRLKSKINGNRIFFACSGYGLDTTWNGLSSIGHYWSGSLHSDTNGRNLDFDIGGVDPQYSDNRFYGFVVRPVM